MFGYTMLGFGQHVQASVPTCGFSASPGLSGSSPLSVTFTDTSTQSPTSWAWVATNLDGLGSYAFISGTSATSQNPVIRFTYTGTPGPDPPETNFSIQLTATNALGAGTPFLAPILVSA